MGQFSPYGSLYWYPYFLTPTVGANAFYDVSYTLRLKAFRQTYWRDRHSWQTRHLMAMPTIEMDMQIVIPIVRMTCANLIMQRSVLVLNGMHQPMFPK